MNSSIAATDFTGDVRHLEDSRFAVPGMRCAGCIAKLESGIGGLAGVAAARVNFSAKQLAVSHDESIDDRALIAEIGKLGFEAQPLSVNPLGADHAERRQLTRALGVSGFAHDEHHAVVCLDLVRRGGCDYARSVLLACRR
jgi:Cu2+-exporting ATPase